MRLELKDVQIINSLAEFLYDFLPGSGSSQWKSHVSFKTITSKLGIAEFWQPGSKLPMLTNLLRRILEERAELFESFILEVLSSGISYRKKRGDPITRAQMIALNGLLLQLGFKFPELWNSQFLASLDQDTLETAHCRAENEGIQTSIPERLRKLQVLKDKFLELSILEDRQKAGLMLQDVLNQMFEIHCLVPRNAFRILGEEIDGSFLLDYETYLLDAKWEKKPLNEQPLLVFRGRIEGKSSVTRGVFLSINGYTVEAKTAITTGKQPNFFTMDGYDLLNILSDEMNLVDFLRARQRLLAEEGAVFVEFHRLTE